MPGIVPPAGQHPGSVGRRGDADARAHVAEIPGILEQHHRRQPRVGEHDGGIDRCPLGERDNPRGRRQRRELGEHLRLDLTHHRGDPLGDVGREQVAEAGQLRGVRCECLKHHGAEAQGVLQRMKSFQHGERRVAPCASEAWDRRAVLHAPMIARDRARPGVKRVYR